MAEKATNPGVGVGDLLNVGVVVAAGALLWRMTRSQIIDLKEDMHRGEQRLKEDMGRSEQRLKDDMSQMEVRLTDRIGHVETIVRPSC